MAASDLTLLTVALQLSNLELVDVSDRIALLTRVTIIDVRAFFVFAAHPHRPARQISNNALSTIPDGLLAMTQMTRLDVRRSRPCVCFADPRPPVELQSHD